MGKAWIIGQYTGDPYKDVMVTYSNAGSLTAASACTVTVEGPVLAVVASGTAWANSPIWVSSTSAQHTAGSVIFTGTAASNLFNYIIVHKALK